MALAGATRPTHIPSKLATSPMAHTCGTAVAQRASISMPPRGPRPKRGRRAVLRIKEFVVAAGQFVARPDADRDHHHVRVDPAAIGHQHALDPHVSRLGAGDDFLRVDAAVHREARVGDEPAHGLPRALIELGSHEPLAAVDDHRVGPERLGAGGRLEPQQTAADGGHHRGSAQAFGKLAHGRRNGPDVLQGPVHVGVLGAGDGQGGRVGAGGQDQFVVLEAAPVGRGDPAVGAVDPDGRGMRFKGDVLPFPQPGIAQGQIHPGVGQRLRQGDPVIGKVDFLGEHGDVHVARLPAGHGLGETMCGGASANHHNAA